ncbi:Puromycin-sensitive aminopeptidase [Picochlorum sp. SENEW3]|nr:Puromycin-sensitive aminopeptidase [Picochlorum sp. SENEW3]
MGLLHSAATLLLLIGGIRAATDQSICSWQEFELPAKGTWVEPLVYKLQLDVLMQEPWTVTGESAIDVIVHQPTKCVVLNSVGVNITEAGAQDLGSAALSYKEQVEQVTLQFDRPLPAGNHTLLFQFRYEMKKALNGFYRSTYVQDREEKTIAVSQFESVAARKAFPCFDEPSSRSEFEISITTDKKYTVLSNMPPAQVMESKTHKAWFFERTPPMSTYLVAFLVGELGTRMTTIPRYDNQTGVEKTPKYWFGGQSPRNLSVSGNPDQTKDAEYGLDSAAQLLLAMEDSFKIAYALPNMKLVGLADFSAGAMENWGLLTYRASLILASSTTSFLGKQEILTTIAHEVAHQWFGNLVTLEWWNSLWAKESWATLFQYLAADVVDPEGGTMIDFQTGVLRGSFQEDLKEPIARSRNAINSPGDIGALYNTVVYQKGASIVYMLRQWVDRNESSQILNPMLDSSSLFMDAVRTYLYNFSYEAVSSEQLLENFGESLGMDIPGMMQTWLYEPSYPVVFVRRDQETGQVWLVQRPMLDNATFGNSCDENSLWWIPVAFRTSMAPEQVMWTQIETCQSSVPITILPDDAWIYVNTGSYGHYRVIYDSHLMGKLIEAVPVPGALPDIDLLSLMQDVTALPADGRIGAFITLTQIVKSRAITDNLSYAEALRGMVMLARRLNCSEDLGRYSRRFIYEPMLELPVPGYPNLTGRDVLGVQNLSEDVPANIQILKSKLFGLIGDLDGPTVPEIDFQGYFDQILDGNIEQDIDPSSYFFIMNQVMRTGRQEVLDKAVETLQNTNDASLKVEILRAIPYFPNQTRILELALSPSIRGQDTLSLIRGTARNPSAGLTCTEWVAENFEQLSAKIGPTLGSGLESVCINVVTDERAISALKKIANAFPDSLKNVENAIAKVQRNRASIEQIQGVCSIVSDILVSRIE